MNADISLKLSISGMQYFCHLYQTLTAQELPTVQKSFIAEQVTHIVVVENSQELHL